MTDHTIRQGEPFRWHVWVTDDDGPVPLDLPAAMDVRKASTTAGELVARLDSDPTGNEGAITPDGLDTDGLVFLLADTTDLAVGKWYYDAWATVDGSPFVLASGRFSVAARVTDDLDA